LIKYPVDKLHGDIRISFETWIEGPSRVLWLWGGAEDSYYGPPRFLFGNINAGNLSRRTLE